MNTTRNMLAPTKFLYRLGVKGRRLLPPQRCSAFGCASEASRIERIYVINLDRQARRWAEMRRELDRINDHTGESLLKRTERVSADDAMDFVRAQVADSEVDPAYTLRDQLFVEPQPRVLPESFELDRPIQMTWQEIAVARSHIGVWRRVATGRDAYALVLEDDAWFKRGFGRYVAKAWRELTHSQDSHEHFDVLYLSYKEVKGGAQKSLLTPSVFRPVRGLWYLSGYVLSREGATRLLGLLPCRGPVDLWINHQFDTLEVRATRRSSVGQRSDMGSANSYSVLPTLSRIGVLDCEGQSLFHGRPPNGPVFAFGEEGSGLSSLAMALSMLGYRCCSDLVDLPESERAQLLSGSSDRVFDAYVNIGTLSGCAATLKQRYPDARFFVATSNRTTSNAECERLPDGLRGDDVALLRVGAVDKWKVVCEHLRCAPPACSYPEIADLGQRPLLDIGGGTASAILSEPRRDVSPWVVDSRPMWQGIRVGSRTSVAVGVSFEDRFDGLNGERWVARDDTFPGNLGLFRKANVVCEKSGGALFVVKREPLGVRDFSAASISSRDRYLFGKFEATLVASNVPGVITGFFLHRDSPRQEIDVEIVGKHSDRLLVNVFYNPGTDGARFDYGYRGAPSILDLGFDASESPHRFGIEWDPSKIRWFVDGCLIHERAIWNPTPIPKLPMSLHVNLWPSRSRELAGRLCRHRLPATATVHSIAVEANLAVGCDQAAHLVDASNSVP